MTLRNGMRSQNRCISKTTSKPVVLDFGIWECNIIMD